MEHSPYIEAANNRRNGRDSKILAVAPIWSAESDGSFRGIYRREDDSRHPLFSDQKPNEDNQDSSIFSVPKRDLPSLSPLQRKRKLVAEASHVQDQHRVEDVVGAPAGVTSRASVSLKKSHPFDEKRITKKRSFAWKESSSESAPPSILATRSEDYSSYSYHKRDHSLLADFADRSGEVTLFQEEKLESTLSFESSVSLPLW